MQKQGRGIKGTLWRFSWKCCNQQAIWEKCCTQNAKTFLIWHTVFWQAANCGSLWGAGRQLSHSSQIKKTKTKLVLDLQCSAPQRHAWRGVCAYVWPLVNRVLYLWVWSPECARDCVLLLVLTDPRLMVWAFSLSSSSQVLHLSAKEL